MIGFALSALLALAAPGPILAQATPAATAAPEDPKITDMVKTEFEAWQKGQLTRSHYTLGANQTFSDDRVAALSEQLRKLGEIKATKYLGSSVEMTSIDYSYRLDCQSGGVIVQLFVDKTGKIAGIGFRPADHAPPAQSS